MDVGVEHQNLEKHSLAKEGSVFLRACDWLDGDDETPEQLLEGYQTAWGVDINLLPWPTDNDKDEEEEEDDDSDDDDVWAQVLRPCA